MGLVCDGGGGLCVSGGDGLELPRKQVPTDRQGLNSLLIPS
jgi:hypothetical protein